MLTPGQGRLVAIGIILSHDFPFLVNHDCEYSALRVIASYTVYSCHICSSMCNYKLGVDLITSLIIEKSTSYTCSCCYYHVLLGLIAQTMDNPCSNPRVSILRGHGFIRAGGSFKLSINFVSVDRNVYYGATARRLSMVSRLDDVAQWIMVQVSLTVRRPWCTVPVEGFTVTS